MASSSSDVSPSLNLIRIASFDIGKKNFAHYIEEISHSDIEELANEYALVKKSKGNIIPTKSPEYKDFLQKVYAKGRRVHTGVYDIRNAEKQDVLDIDTRKNLIKHLSSFEELWRTCDAFIIEQQYFRPSTKGRRSGGTEANVDAIKIAEALMIWLLGRYPDKIHGYFPSTNKTQLLCAPPRLGRKEVKMFCFEEAKKLYTLRNDQGMMELFNLQATIKGKRNLEKKRDEFLKGVPSYESGEADGTKDLADKILLRQKLDDVCDACTQLQAYKIKHLIIGLPFM